MRFLLLALIFFVAFDTEAKTAAKPGRVGPTPADVAIAIPKLSEMLSRTSNPNSEPRNAKLDPCPSVGARAMAFSSAPAANPSLDTGNGSAGSSGSPTSGAGEGGTAASYFAFDNENPIDEAQAKTLVAQYGPKTLIGFDPNNGNDEACKKAGALCHLYSEGTGGETDGAWAPDECVRIKRRAQAEGLNVGNSEDGSDCESGAWVKAWRGTHWKDGKWWTSTQKQLIQWKPASMEIDNLPKVKADGPGEIVAFLQDFDRVRKANGLKTSLLPKNLESNQYTAIQNAIQSGQLPRDILTSCGINEEGIGAGANGLNISVLRSVDTNQYRAQGKCGGGSVPMSMRTSPHRNERHDINEVLPDLTSTSLIALFSLDDKASTLN